MAANLKSTVPSMIGAPSGGSSKNASDRERSRNELNARQSSIRSPANQNHHHNNTQHYNNIPLMMNGSASPPTSHYGGSPSHNSSSSANNASSRIPTRVSQANIKMINAMTAATALNSSPNRTSSSSSASSGIPLSPHHLNQQTSSNMFHDTFNVSKDTLHRSSTNYPLQSVNSEGNLLSANECITPRTQPAVISSVESLPSPKAKRTPHTVGHGRSGRAHLYTYDSNKSSPALIANHQPQHQHNRFGGRQSSHHNFNQHFSTSSSEQPLNNSSSQSGPKFEYFLMTGDHILNLTGKQSYSDSPNTGRHGGRRAVMNPRATSGGPTGRRDTFVIASNSLPASPTNNLDHRDEQSHHAVSSYPEEDQLTQSTPCPEVTRTDATFRVDRTSNVADDEDDYHVLDMSVDNETNDSGLRRSSLSSIERQMINKETQTQSSSGNPNRKHRREVRRSSDSSSAGPEVHHAATFTSGGSRIARSATAATAASVVANSKADCTLDRDSFSSSSSSSSSNCSKNSSYLTNNINYVPPNPLVGKKAIAADDGQEEEGYALLKNAQCSADFSDNNSTASASHEEETSDLSCGTDAILSSNASANLSRAEHNRYEKNSKKKHHHHHHNHGRRGTLPAEQTESSMSEGYSLVSSISGMGALFNPQLAPSKSASFTANSLKNQRTLSITSSFDSESSTASISEDLIRGKDECANIQPAAASSPNVAKPSDSSLNISSAKEKSAPMPKVVHSPPPSPKKHKPSKPTSPISGPPPSSEEEPDLGGAMAEHEVDEDETDSESSSVSVPAFVPKAVDSSSAVRLAKRLYHLEGFKRNDVSPHLAKTNEFTRLVAEEYMKHFDFKNDTLDAALHKFLARFALLGETAERERVLQHFSKRYMEFHPTVCNSQDALHTLTCGLLLLNSDLHNEQLKRKMTLGEFLENLSGLNDGEDFERSTLSRLYDAIKSRPIELPTKEDVFRKSSSGRKSSTRDIKDNRRDSTGSDDVDLSTINPFLHIPDPNSGTEMKSGWISRKHCSGPGGKKTSVGKRGWRTFYAVMRDLTIYFYKDETGVKSASGASGGSTHSLYESLNNAIRIHHAMCTRATDYHKRSNVFRLMTADRSEYLFQSSSPHEMENWMSLINYSSASLSAAPLAAPIGSQARQFQRPVLPSSHTKLDLKSQLTDHVNRLRRFEMELEKHLHRTPDRGAPRRLLDEFVEKQNYIHHELQRYRLYVSVMRDHHPELMGAAFGNGNSSGANVSHPSSSSSSAHASALAHLVSRSLTAEVIGEENITPTNSDNESDPSSPHAKEKTSMKSNAKEKNRKQ